jgi:hypothetical protein
MEQASPARRGTLSLRETHMQITRLALAVAASVLLLSATPVPASAQSCPGLYARMMEAFGTGSPRYPELRARYAESCERGPDRRGDRPGRGDGRGDWREGRGDGPGRGQGAICRELRQACLNKEQLGERGEGNCRQYRETCQR